MAATISSEQLPPVESNWKEADSMQIRDLLSVAFHNSVSQMKCICSHGKPISFQCDRPGCNSFPQRLEDGEEGGGRSFFRIRHIEHPGGAGFAFIPTAGTSFLLFDPGRLVQLLPQGIDG